MKKLFVAALCAVTSFIFAQNKENSNKWTSGRPDGHAPISVLADHMHSKGDFMLSYRYMTMDMQGLRQSTKDAKSTDALSNYMASPETMAMRMHMLGFMYAPNNKITLMLMSNHIENYMTLSMRNGNQFKTNTTGLGDFSISALYSLFNKNRKTMHTQIAFYIPTGRIDKKDVIPSSMGKNVQLPYPMQTGTGSFGTKIGLTYLQQCDKFSWGHQLNAKININDNEQDYKFGNRYNLNNWLAVNIGGHLSTSLRLEGVIIDKIEGISPLLNPMMVTTADTANSGGYFINSGYGLNYVFTNGGLKGLRFAAEITAPLFQDLNGIQLKQKYNLTFGAQYAF